MTKTIWLLETKHLNYIENVLKGQKRPEVEMDSDIVFNRRKSNASLYLHNSFSFYLL